LLEPIRGQRPATLFAAVVACISGPGLTLTDVA